MNSNSVEGATQLNHFPAMSTTSGSETSDDSMNPRLDNLTPPESPGEVDPLYTPSTACERAPSQSTLSRAQHASRLEQKSAAKGRQSVHSPKSHLRNASSKFVERQPSPSPVITARQRRRREDKRQHRIKRLAEEMQLATVSSMFRTRQEGQGRFDQPLSSTSKSKRSTVQSPQHAQLT